MARKDGLLNYYPPPLYLSSTLLPPPPPPPPESPPGTKISPAVLFVIVILAVLFFISGLLHLLVRFLTKNPNSSSSSANGYPDISTTDALERQLQQLFHLHDSGLDQAFIDALPVFLYSEIVGLKEPFDCAVCLSEFSEKDKLRLLPTCGHAFHISCIDTWLLSNSSCPLCRNTLFTPGFPMDNPIFEYDEYPGEEEGCSRVGQHGFQSVHQKTAEIEEVGGDKKGVLPVRLGKFRKLDGGSMEPTVAEASNSNLDARRCYSMGSYQYVVGDTNLRVTLCPDQERRKNVVGGTQQNSGGLNSLGDGDLEGKKISSMSRGDSYSVSKIWLWPKKGELPSSSGDARIDLPPLGTEFPWVERTSNV